MRGIVIDIWEKSNFWGSFGSQKGAKNFVQVYGRVKEELKKISNIHPLIRNGTIRCS